MAESAAERGYLGVKVGRLLLGEMDRIAEAAGVSRSDVVRMTLEAHLADTERRLSAATEGVVCANCALHCGGHAQ